MAPGVATLTTAEVVRHFGIGEGQALGAGGEAEVYALGGDRVLRVHREGATRERVEGRAALLAGIGRTRPRPPFHLPAVRSVEEVGGRLVSVETRLPGRSMMKALAEARGGVRAALIRALLDAAARVGDLALPEPRPARYGELLAARPVCGSRFATVLEALAARGLRAAGPEFEGVDAGRLAAAWPEPEAPALVHLDVFPGNVLVEGERVSALLDFGPLALAGDRRLDPIVAAAYLDDTVTPCAGPLDRTLAREWLRERGLAALAPAAARWLGAFWSGAPDPRLRVFARRLLGGSVPDGSGR